ncbi:uncharacterized protein LOC117181608 [Belonocnema kinseyi]|uniref:uncharacterized protein LOC117181608 n=1 Tax=Belonocnema kinseyi TaxID=2817044 RepID=UPI00143D7533|nr:uncharacterized protein LOC117181608 [Belonocnema kinseyi]
MINEGKIIGSQNVISLVMVALKNLQDTDGSTIRKILNYISQSFPRRAPKKRIIAALKRGVEFGIMKQKRGHYFLPSSDDVSTRRLESFELHSTIPLSIVRANIRSRGAKKNSKETSIFLYGSGKRYQGDEERNWKKTFSDATLRSF